MRQYKDEDEEAAEQPTGAAIVGLLFVLVFGLGLLLTLVCTEETPERPRVESEYVK